MLTVYEMEALMIYIRILDTKNLIGADILEAVRSLPFGKAEADRLSSLRGDTRRLESLGALMALRDILPSNKTSAEIARNSDNGKPYFKDASMPHFSLAHSCGICAAVTADAEVGIDIELIRPTPHKNELAERFFTEDEKQRLRESDTDENFLLIWTQKEALVKMRGDSLACSLRKPLPHANRVLCDVIDLGNQRLAITVCSAKDDEISISIAN